VVLQPSTETFMLSNKVIIVSSGRVMYCGPTAEVIAYFTSPRLGYRYDGRSNPADFAIAVVSGAEKSDCPDLRYATCLD
jgi:ABC-type multidrug transport system ATPase subunit